jgi:putative hydrolase of the HAD superfamily
MKHVPRMPAFGAVETWIFDLDNTLYPAECDLFAQVDRRMGAFIGALLGVDPVEARRVQKRYYRDYGTTLRGLMHEHQVEPLGFLDYVHDIDLSPVPPDRMLCAAIAALPGRKFILTNGTRAHAEKVARRIGVLEHFDDIFDIAAGDFVPKPDPAIYRRFIERLSILPARAAIFEDLSRNLEAPSALGMTTVLVKVAGRPHPDAREDWTPQDETAAHVDHVTDDLSGFLGEILGALDGARRRLT